MQSGNVNYREAVRESSPGFSLGKLKVGKLKGSRLNLNLKHSACIDIGETARHYSHGTAA